MAKLKQTCGKVSGNGVWKSEWIKLVDKLCGKTTGMTVYVDSMQHKTVVIGLLSLRLGVWAGGRNGGRPDVVGAVRVGVCGGNPIDR